MSFRDDFPALNGPGSDIVYLDSAATTLKPTAVADAVNEFLTSGTAAVHRAVHSASQQATEKYERTRELLAKWFSAKPQDVVLTHGATEAINLVANGLPDLHRVACTAMEHHSNLIPWMRNSDVQIIPVDRNGVLDLDVLRDTLRQGIDLLAVCHQSNVLGAVVDLERVVGLAKEFGTKLLVDAAQSASHAPPNLAALPIDYLVCSSHKMLGPSGAGALIGTTESLSQLSPLIYGGHMVDQVSVVDFSVRPIPERFEAGTPPIESVIGWGTALEYLSNAGVAAMSSHLDQLTSQLVERLNEMPAVSVLGPGKGESRGPLVSFNVDNMEALAVAKILNQRDSIFVRSGFHCAQALHQHLGVPATVRASLQIYNNEADLERLTKALRAATMLSAM